MSSDSLPGKVWNTVTQPAKDVYNATTDLSKGDFGAAAGDAAKGYVDSLPGGPQVVDSLGRSLKPKDQGAPPDIPGVNPADATNTALNAQLQNELNIRRSMALVTGGQGVMAAPRVSTAGQSLLGI